MNTIKELYDLFKKYPFISTDSRNIKANSIFFALKGDNFNGNLYAEQSITKGAAIAIIDDITLKKDERYVVVEDTLRALQELASYHRKQLKIPVIGITGTNGKTTTKELTKAVLSKKFKTYATQGNLNNHIGVPLTLLSITKNIEIAVIEMGANHVGEIKELCEIAQPNHGLITNIGKAHLEGFGSYEGVIQAKTELYHYLQEQKGNIFVNADNSLLMEHASITKKYTYGTKNESNCVGEILSSDPFLKVKWRKSISDAFTINSNLVGSYNFENVMAAIAIGSYFKIEAKLISDAIEEYVPTNNRSQVIKTLQNTLLMDAYNANPSSMKAAISNFASMKVENKVVILGDMMELGNDSEKEHQHVLDLLMSFQFPYVILIGNYFKQLTLPKFVLNFADTQIAMEELKKHSIKNSTILVKGSRKVQLEKLVEVL
jgi:UDP-N-acetylmuramoyl-tripeptide--D-alanyl-D-alanine ligase